MSQDDSKIVFVIFYDPQHFMKNCGNTLEVRCKFCTKLLCIPEKQIAGQFQTKANASTCDEVKCQRRIKKYLNGDDSDDE